MNSSTSTATPTITETDFYVTPGDQIPFLFCAIPHTVVDNKYFASDPMAFLVLSKLARYIDLKKHQVVNKQRLKSGWSLPINQQSLATQVNVGRETLNRKLKLLEDKGFIESRQIGRLKTYRLTDYAVTGAQVLEMQNNASQGKIDPSEDQMTVPELVGFTSGKVEKGDSQGAQNCAADQDEKLPLDISIKQAAEMLGVSPRYINEARKIKRESPEHFEEIKNGHKSIQQVKRELNLVPVVAETPMPETNCDSEITEPVTQKSHLLIDNPLKELTSSTSNKTSDSEITPATSDPELDQAKQQSLDDFASAKREINQSVPPAVRKRIKTRDLDRFSAELCDSYGTVSPVQAMAILQRCTKIKKLPAFCPQNSKPIGSPIWFLGVGHDNYLLPVLAEMGLAELPPVQEKSQVESPKPTSKFGLEAGGRGKVFRAPDRDPNAITLAEALKLHEKRNQQGKAGFNGKLAEILTPKTGPKPESTEQMTEQTAENGLKTSQKLDDNEAVTDV